MKIYSHYEYNHFVICLGYRGNLIKQYFLDYEAMNNDFTIHLGNTCEINFHGGHDERDFIITLVNTGKHTLTGGRVLKVQKYIDTEDFMVTYGDGVSDINIESLIKFHKSHGLIGTITAVRPFSPFGVMHLDQNNCINHFEEKPQLEGWVNAGFFVFKKEIFNYFEEDDCILEQDLLPRLAQVGQLAAYRHHGIFMVMDTYKQYLTLNHLWESGAAPWKIWG